jgi:hypothetical protein
MRQSLRSCSKAHYQMALILPLTPRSRGPGDEAHSFSWKRPSPSRRPVSIPPPGSRGSRQAGRQAGRPEGRGVGWRLEGSFVTYPFHPEMRSRQPKQQLRLHIWQTYVDYIPVPVSTVCIYCIYVYTPRPYLIYPLDSETIIIDARVRTSMQGTDLNCSTTHTHMI